MRERDMRSTMTARATTNDVARITAEVAALEEEVLAEWEEAMSQSHAANRAPLIESPLGIPYVEPTCANVYIVVSRALLERFTLLDCVNAQQSRPFCPPPHTRPQKVKVYIFALECVRAGVSQ
jgi:hypothetical protein